MKKNNNEYIPDDEIWLVFDMANGDATTKRYVWWFSSEEEANNWIVSHNNLKNAVPVSAPICYSPK